MNTVALDTNVISNLMSGHIAEIAQTLDRIHAYYVPWAVYGELLAGVQAGSNPAKYTAVLDDFLHKPYVTLSTVTAAETVPYYAAIYHSLKRRGTPVSPNDLWIAAECAQQGLPLFTLDKDFSHIEQILLI